MAAIEAGRVDPLSAVPDDADEPWSKHRAADIRAIELRKARKAKAAAKRRAEKLPF